MWGLGEALKTLKPSANGKLSVKQLGLAMEKVRFDTSMGEIAMRPEDHQALLPLAVSVVSKEAKYKVDGTDLGFKPVRLISGKEAAGSVQPSCHMDRPAS
jgi:branched-chain amino acid transport system substrate-binding protein